MNQSESIKNIATAMIAVQSELAPIAKDKVNPFFNSKYAGLESVMPAALKLLNKHGLALVQTVGNGAHDGGTTLSTTLLHESGEWLGDTQPLLLVKPDPQGQGSAITYARRYALMAMLGMVAEDDDDGNAASPPRDARPPAQQYAEAQRTYDGPKRMESKYAGTCYECGNKVAVGDKIYYGKNGGKSVVWHEACYAPDE